MYSSSYYSSAAESTGPNILLILLFFCFAIAVLAAFLVSINLFVERAREKGYFEKTGLLWFIGIFATPIVVGLYVLSLPDLSGTKNEKKDKKEFDLPPV